MAVVLDIINMTAVPNVGRWYQLPVRRQVPHCLLATFFTEKFLVNSI